MYEYKVIDLADKQTPEVTKLLNELGTGGWEPVTTLHDGSAVILRRFTVRVHLGCKENR